MKHVMPMVVLLLSVSTPLLACQSGGNLVTNCTFTGNANNWDQETGSCAHSATLGVGGVAGNYSCNSFAGMFNHIVRFRRCLPQASGVVGGKPYSYSAFAQLATGANVACTLEFADFTSDNCMFNVNAETTPLVLGSPPDFSASVPDTYQAAPGTVSISVRVECLAPAPFTVRVDNVFVAVEDAIFKNSFD